MDQSGCKSELPFLTFNTLEFFLTQTAFVWCVSPSELLLLLL
jgi:hypothetical protein